MSGPELISPEESVLAAEYALGLLDDAETADVSARIATDPALRAEVEGWHEQLAALADDLSAAPPPGAKRRLMRRLEKKKNSVSSDGLTLSQELELSRRELRRAGTTTHPSIELPAMRRS